MRIGDIKYISNKQKMVVSKVLIYGIDSHYIHIRTYVTDTILNPAIIKFPLEKKEELVFDNYIDAICAMGIFFYTHYGVEDFDEPKIKNIIDDIRIHINTNTMMEWIQLAKNKYPKKFI